MSAKALPRVMRVFGPLNMKRKNHGIAWTFTGIREGGELCRWTLWFDARSRKFKTFRQSPKPGDEKLSQPGLFPTYIEGKPTVGRITPMLRANLKPHHIAEATELALRIGGGQ